MLLSKLNAKSHAIVLRKNRLELIKLNAKSHAIVLRKNRLEIILFITKKGRKKEQQ
jgi:hypothetical protein